MLGCQVAQIDGHITTAGRVRQAGDPSWVSQSLVNDYLRSPARLSWSAMPKNAERFSDDIMLSVPRIDHIQHFGSIRPEIIVIQVRRTHC